MNKPMTVKELRDVLSDENIPDDAEVRVEVSLVHSHTGRFFWGVADGYGMYYGDGNFWIEGTHPTK